MMLENVYTCLRFIIPFFFPLSVFMLMSFDNTISTNFYATHALACENLLQQKKRDTHTHTAQLNEIRIAKKCGRENRVEKHTELMQSF